MPEETITTLVDLRDAIGDIIEEENKGRMDYEGVGKVADSIVELLFDNFKQIRQMKIGPRSGM